MVGVPSACTLGEEGATRVLDVNAEPDREPVLTGIVSEDLRPDGGLLLVPCGLLPTGGFGIPFSAGL